MGREIYLKCLRTASCAAVLMILALVPASAKTIVGVVYQAETESIKAVLNTDRPERAAVASVYDSTNDRYWVLSEFERTSAEEFTYTCALNPGMPSGEYTLEVTVGGEKASDVFIHINKETATDAMAKVNAATEGSFADTIRSDGVCSNLAINLNDFNSYADMLTHLYFLYKPQYITSQNPKGDLTVSEFSKMYSRCLALCRLKGKNGVQIEEYLKEKHDNVDFDYAAFYVLPETARTEILNRFSGGVYAEPSLEKQYEVWFALADINLKRENSVAVYEEAITKTYSSLLALDLTKYNSLSNKDEVIKKLMKQSFDTIDALKTAFAAAVKTAGGSGGGGGGGSSSGSSVGGNSGANIYLNNTDADTLSAFSDVATGHWCAKPIEIMFNKGIVSGVGNGRFMPDRAVTRAEFAKMLVSALYPGYQPQGKASFDDVSESDWYNLCVNAAYELGIVSGVSETSFMPDAQISRQDMAVMLLRALDKNGIAPAAEKKEFSDDDEISEYAKQAVAALGGASILNGMGENMFEPRAVLSRAQAVQALYKAMELAGRL